MNKPELHGIWTQAAWLAAKTPESPNRYVDFLVNPLSK